MNNFPGAITACLCSPITSPLSAALIQLSLMQLLHRQIVTARLQQLVTAVSRITLKQRMQLVFQGYIARFAEIGAYCQGALSQPVGHHSSCHA